MNDQKVPLYECKVNSDVADETGVFRVSFVSYPAIESGFIKLKSAKPDPVPVHLNKDKQIVTGPALIPDKEIFRLGGEYGAYFIKFTAAAIEEISRKFLKQGFTNETNLEHEIPLQGNTVVESWISSPGKDGKGLGFDLPFGTWFLSIHIPDATLWEEEIKSGKRTGFSIEGIFDYMKVAELKKQHNNLSSDMKGLFARLAGKRKKQKLGAATLDDGRAIAWDDETLEIWFTTEDGERGEAVPDGTYTTDQGVEIVVAGGMIESATEPEEGEALHTILLDNGRILDVDPSTLDAFFIDLEETTKRTPAQDGEYYALNWDTVVIVDGKFSREASSYPFVAEAPAETVTEEAEVLSDLLLSVREKGEGFKERAKKAEAELAELKAERDGLKEALSKVPGAPKIDTTPKAPAIPGPDKVKLRQQEKKKATHRVADVFAKKGKKKKSGE